MGISNHCQYLQKFFGVKKKSELLQAEIGQEGDIEIELIGPDSPEELLMSNQLKNVIENCLNQLSEETKTAITLREFEGLSYVRKFPKLLIVRLEP